MNRRTFLNGALFSVPAGVIANRQSNGRAAKAVHVVAGRDRDGDDIRLPGGSSNYCKVSAKDTDGAMAVFVGESGRKGGPPLHVHSDQEEWFYVIEGQFALQIGEERFRLGPGDCVLAPRKVPHTWASLSDGPTKLMVAFQPAGRMEAFFRELGKIAGPPSQEQMQRLFRDHGMEIVGQPLSIER